MHELSVCQHLFALLDREVRQHGVNKVIRLRLTIGRLSCLDPDALRFAFNAMAPGTVAEAAELEIDQPPIRAMCKTCGSATELLSRFGSCSSCGGTLLELEGGEEMRLLEMEAV